MRRSVQLTLDDISDAVNIIRLPCVLGALITDSLPKKGIKFYCEHWPKLYFMHKTRCTNVQGNSTGATFTFNNIILFSFQILYLPTSIMKPRSNSACHFLISAKLWANTCHIPSSLFGFHFIIWVYNTHICRVYNARIRGVIFIYGYFINQHFLNAWGLCKPKYKLFINILIISHLASHTIC